MGMLIFYIIRNLPHAGGPVGRHTQSEFGVPAVLVKLGIGFEI
jgi:hypothetical protein